MVLLLLVVAPIVGFYSCSMCCCALLCVYSSFAISYWWERKSWLHCLVCLHGVSWLSFCSSSRCHRVVCSLWLWYFLIILTNVVTVCGLCLFLVGWYVVCDYGIFWWYWNNAIPLWMQCRGIAIPVPSLGTRCPCTLKQLLLSKITYINTLSDLLSK